MVVQAEHLERVEDDGYVTRKYGSRNPTPIRRGVPLICNANSLESARIVAIPRDATFCHLSRPAAILIKSLESRGSGGVFDTPGVVFVCSPFGCPVRGCGLIPANRRSNVPICTNRWEASVILFSITGSHCCYKGFNLTVYIARYQCRIPIPLDVDPESVESAVTPDGILIITARKTAKTHEVIVPVIQMNHLPHRHEHPHLTPGCP